MAIKLALRNGVDADFVVLLSRQNVEDILYSLGYVMVVCEDLPDEDVCRLASLQSELSEIDYSDDEEEDLSKDGGVYYKPQNF